MLLPPDPWSGQSTVPTSPLRHTHETSGLTPPAVVSLSQAHALLHSGMEPVERTGFDDLMSTELY